MQYAPIALFIYKRPEHTLRTMQSLIANAGFSSSKVFVFSDGPKSEVDRSAVQETRQVIKSFNLPNVEMIEQDCNQGLASSIIQGVSRICNESGRAIILEDDLELSPAFLSYMNCALDFYECVPNVLHVSGYMFPARISCQTAVMLPFTNSWGWGTWKRAWDIFDPNGTGFEMLSSDRVLKRRFDLNGAYPFSRMLQRQMKGEIDSWAIRWYWSVFRQGGLAIYPPQSLVRNIGFDGSGTHCGGRSVEDDELLNGYDLPLPGPALSVQEFKQVEDYLRKSFSLPERMRTRFTFLMKKSLGAAF